MLVAVEAAAAAAVGFEAGLRDRLVYHGWWRVRGRIGRCYCGCCYRWERFRWSLSWFWNRLR